MKSFLKINYPTGLNFLTKDECINEKDNSHAINVWKTFKIGTMGDYHDFYLKTDVLLLADVFEKFIDTCLEHCELDPCRYFSRPGLRWNAMLKMTGIELELISDIDMHLVTEKGMRGDISYFAKRHSKANNKYMKCYDSSKASKFIMHLDVYVWVMSQYLPYSGFKWLNPGEIDNFDMNSISENSSDKYILEVDLEHPDELHNDYPLAPEKIEISHNMLSNYCSNIANKYEIKIGGLYKLVPNLDNKSKYVLHYRNLQSYL